MGFCVLLLSFVIQISISVSFKQASQHLKITLIVHNASQHLYLEFMLMILKSQKQVYFVAAAQLVLFDCYHGRCFCIVLKKLALLQAGTFSLVHSFNLY